MTRVLQKIWRKSRFVFGVALKTLRIFSSSLKHVLKPFKISDELFVINDTSHQNSIGRGFFSLFREVLYLISLNSEKNIEVAYYKTDYNDEPDDNIWEYCFLPIDNRPERKKPYRYLFATEPFKNSFADSQRYRNIFNRIINDRIKIRKEIENKISEFISRNFSGKKVVGVHFRGADTLYATNLQPKRSLKKLPIENYFSVIDGLLKEGYNAIFLGTDDEEAFKKFKEKYGEKLCSYSSIRSSEQGAVYDWGLWRTNISLKKTDKRQVCEEALVDAVLLSKCDHFIHGQSNLSCAVKYFSARIPSKNMELPELSFIQRAENLVLYS